MIPKTAISLGLRTIPPSTGFSRAIRRSPQRIVGHHIKEATRFQFRVESDKDLEDEIKRSKEAQK